MCGVSLTCTYTPAGSGTMQLQAVVNGVVQVRSAHILVDDCLTGDSILNTKKLRDALKNTWDNTPKTGPADDRMERLSDCVPTADGCDWQLLPPDGADYCSHPLSGLNPNSGGTIHVHPWDPVTDSLPIPLPAHCLAEGTPQPQPGDKWHSGPSSLDIDNLDPAVTHWVIDPNFVYKIPGGNLTKEERSKVRFFPRRFGYCDPLHS